MAYLPCTRLCAKHFTRVTPLNPLTTLVSMFCYSHFRAKENDVQKITSLAPRSTPSWCGIGSFWPQNLFLNPALNQLWGEQNLDKEIQGHGGGAFRFLGSGWGCDEAPRWRLSLRLGLTASRNPRQELDPPVPSPGELHNHQLVLRLALRGPAGGGWEVSGGSRPGDPGECEALLPTSPHPPAPPAHFCSLSAFTLALSHILYELASDPQEGGPDLRHHALVSGSVFPEDAAGTSKTQLRHTHQLPGTCIWI